MGIHGNINTNALAQGILKLADFTSDATTKSTLLALASPAAYPTEISLKRVSILDLLERFPTTVSLPFGTFLSLLPAMRPRSYSISSSTVTGKPNRATLTYALVDQPSWANPSNAHVGVASSYLASLQPGDRLHVSVRKQTPASGFRLPDPAVMAKTPIICVAAGTGLAPFRGFVQERAALLGQEGEGVVLDEALLFFGCRGPKVDDLYREEFDESQKQGAVDVRRAFSRVEGEEGDEAKGCRYVQDRLWFDKEEVAGLWERGARVYVCGSRKVGEEVKRVLGRIVLGGEPSEEEITKWFDSVRNERYAVDVFD